MSINLVPVLLVGVVLFSIALGLAYKYWIQPQFQLHFGEIDFGRRNYEARRRRRQFERRSWAVLQFIFAGVIFGAVQGFLEGQGIQATGFFTAMRITCASIAGLLALAAISRWRNPHDD